MPAVTRPSEKSAGLKGLYVILDPSTYGARSLVSVLVEAAEAGARLFQYRDKTASMKDAYREALRLREASADAHAILIINDRCDLALAVEADGVHLGQEDLPLGHARDLMGPGKIIGISTHRPDQVDLATKEGADYLGFGPISATGTKADHEPVIGLDGLRQARARTHLPIFAIGGVTLETAGSTIEAGADGIAVVSALATAADLADAVRAFLGKIG